MTKQKKKACVPSEDSDQPGHPASLIRVFAVRTKKAWALSYPLSADAQADLNLRWVHRSFCWFCHEATDFIELYVFNAASDQTPELGNHICYNYIFHFNRHWFYGPPK